MQRYINGALLYFEFTEIMSDREYERRVEKDCNFYADFSSHLFVIFIQSIFH